MSGEMVLEAVRLVWTGVVRQGCRMRMKETKNNGCSWSLEV